MTDNHEHQWTERNRVPVWRNKTIIGYIVQYTCSCGEGKSRFEEV